MDLQVVEVNKEDKIVIVTSKMEYTFTPERYNMVHVTCMCVAEGTNYCETSMVLC